MLRGQLDDPDLGNCYEKGEVAYFIRPRSTPGSEERSRSEFLPGGGRPIPKEAPFRVYWNRTFVGEPAVATKVEALTTQHAKLAGVKEKRFADRRTKKELWKLEDSECQQACVFLGPDCRGFSYTPFGSRCALFRTIRGIATEADGTELHTPTVVSGCTAGEQDCPKGADQ